ncbi:MAG: iron ABC transporter permease [Chloroflexi bacterium]|nr:iron ABC transporter permease [Chloroflexota bacterium]
MADPAYGGAATTAARGRLGDRWLVVLAVMLLVALIGIPLVRLLGVAVGGGVGNVLATLADPGVGGAILNSLWTAALIAILAVVGGTAAALATERGGLPGAGWLRAGILLPLLCPPFVTAFGWTRAYGPRGLADRAFGVEVPGLFGPLGIVLVLAVAALPLAWLIVAGALATRVEPDAERAARASGAAPSTVLRTVTLPLLRPAILSALVVTFVFAVNAFGVPAILGTPAGFTTITTRLYQDLARSSDPALFAEAGVLAATLVVLAIAVVGPADAWLTGRPATRTGESAGGRAGPTRAGVRRRRVAAFGLGSMILLVAVVPLVAVLLTALTRAVGLAPVPANWTLANFGEALDARFADGLVHSLVLAVGTATIVVPLGALLVVVGRRRGRGRSVLRTAATLGFALPGSALAIAILLAYGGWLRDTLAVILVAYVAKLWALGQRQVAGSVDQLPIEIVRAARASGAGPAAALRTVVVPLLRPSLIAAWLIVFLFAFHELTMSALLYGPRTATLSVVVLNAQQLGDPTVSAALAALLVGLIGVIAVPLVLVTRRWA